MNGSRACCRCPHFAVCIPLGDFERRIRDVPFPSQLDGECEAVFRCIPIPGTRPQRRGVAFMISAELAEEVRKDD